MAVQDKKVSDLVPLVNVSSDDLLLVVDDPNGNPTSRKISFGNLLSNLSIDTTFTSNVNVNGTDVFQGINDKLQVANATLLINNRMQVSNTLTLLDQNRTQILADFADSLETEPQQVFEVSVKLGLVANTLFANSTVSASNTLILRQKSEDPATSNASVEGISAGSIFYSNTYLYIATDENTIKRITLEDF